MIEDTQVEEVAENAPETTGVAVQHGKRLSMCDFIAQMGDNLLEAIREQNPPVYDESKRSEKRAAIMASLKRQPFAAQANVVQAITKLLLDANERAAIINADMGTGKSLMGAVTASILHAEGFQRTLVLAPPHLVYKWRREILETVPNAKVQILNGSDTFARLLVLKENVDAPVTCPEFYILGRVRLRLGSHWKPAYYVRRHYAYCPDCGKKVTDSSETCYTTESFPQDKRIQCGYCRAPLWTMARKQKPDDKETCKALIKHLCGLPTIGKKLAEKLIAEFGEAFLANALSDNIHQFINLMDKSGSYVFSERQAARMERALGKTEFALGSGSYQASEFIKRYLPKGFFGLLIVDEAHEYKSYGSAQGQAMGVIASQVKKVLLLTGTLMGGYADDLFYLLWRMMPKRMLEDGYRHSRGALYAAVRAFMKNHGILKKVARTKTSSHKTSRGNGTSERIIRQPGFGPHGVSRYLLPYAAFLKLEELEQNVLPPYTEHCVSVGLTPTQAMAYERLSGTLMQELRYALRAGDRSLMGVVLNCLLAWPDCCFRPEVVNHPHKKQTLASLPVILGEEPSPKELKMLALCEKAKARGQKALVYTTYTGTRDTAERLKRLLTEAGFKAGVLRASVKAEKREDWIAEQVDDGLEVLICHPELVKTGLDLLEFPFIIFMQSGFNVYTLMQASRRSWRIGQKQDVHVYFLGYTGTAQMDCLKLMAKKIAVAQSTSGKMPETGLDILNQEGDSIEVALAKTLLKEA